MAGGYLLNITVVLNLFQKLSTPALYFLNIQKISQLKTQFASNCIRNTCVANNKHTKLLLPLIH